MFLRLHRKIVQIFSPKAPAVIIFYCMLFLAVLGWLDIVTGDESLIAFYLIPVSFAAWFVSKRSGVIISLLASVVLYVADVWPKQSFPLVKTFHQWNLLVEVVFLLGMSQLFAELKRTLDNETNLARRDPLTDTLNRRSFFDLAEHEINRSRRYDQPMTVAYIDVDNFKTINDQLGHHVGDDLLVTVVSTIRSNIRNSDILARFGGDEFVILLPDTPAEAAVSFLNKIHFHLDQSMADKSWPVSFSIGAATYLHPTATVDEIIRHADKLMYSVKHDGKNRLLHEEIVEVING